MSTLPTDPARWQRWTAELLGTLGWPVFTGAYAFGPVSGCHVNPAVSIGLALTLIHLISINISNTSVNPARSLGVAFFAGPAALAHVWLFLLAPIAGALLAGFVYIRVFEGWGPAEDTT